MRDGFWDGITMVDLQRLSSTKFLERKGPRPWPSSRTDRRPIGQGLHVGTGHFRCELTAESSLAGRCKELQGDPVGILET